MDAKLVFGTPVECELSLPCSPVNLRPNLFQNYLEKPYGAHLVIANTQSFVAT